MCAVRGRGGYRYHPYGAICPSPIVTSGMYWPRTANFVLRFEDAIEIQSAAFHWLLESPMGDFSQSIAGWEDILGYSEVGFFLLVSEIRLKSLATEMARLSFHLFLEDILFGCYLESDVEIETPIQNGQGFITPGWSPVNYGPLGGLCDLALAFTYNRIQVELYAEPW